MAVNLRHVCLSNSTNSRGIALCRSSAMSSMLSAPAVMSAPARHLQTAGRDCVRRYRQVCVGHMAQVRFLGRLQRGDDSSGSNQVRIVKGCAGNLTVSSMTVQEHLSIAGK
ncbi:hypothetical protein B0T36_03780 [Nocardia donostiensis]|uniref:hypothetical protein n=1 Tax=Nocardia donostiensis TaxID=1538463 RepID=UPI0009D980CB|nr:hypothetical protein [Nocardia donostiensis]OQS16784.1 hypothetical protein B0T36_03780 [Nocardia donostiensis]